MYVRVEIGHVARAQSGHRLLEDSSRVHVVCVCVPCIRVPMRQRAKLTTYANEILWSQMEFDVALGFLSDGQFAKTYERTNLNYNSVYKFISKMRVFIGVSLYVIVWNEQRHCHFAIWMGNIVRYSFIFIAKWD